jgi:hypothetical protein
MVGPVALKATSVIAVKVVSVKTNALIVLQMEGPQKTCAPDVENVNAERATVKKELDKNAW